MSRRLRILRDTLLLAGAAMVIVFGGAALAARPIPLFDFMRALPFVLLGCFVVAVALALVFPSRPVGALDPRSLAPALDDLSFDEARRDADATLARVGVQRRFDKAPDDLAALAQAHPTIVQFAHDWGSLLVRELDLEIALALAAERLRAADRPRPGEERAPVGAWGDRLLLADLHDGSVAIVGSGDGPHPVTPSLHHAVVYASRAPLPG